MRSRSNRNLKDQKESSPIEWVALIVIALVLASIILVWLAGNDYYYASFVLAGIGFVSVVGVLFGGFTYFTTSIIQSLMSANSQENALLVQKTLTEQAKTTNNQARAVSAISSAQKTAPEPEHTFEIRGME